LAVAAGVLTLSIFVAARGQQRPIDLLPGQNPADFQLYRPATRPAGSLHAQIATEFAELNSADPAERERARRVLMELGTQDLTSLEKVVRQSLPLAPAQSNVLREIVFHCRAAAEPYPSSSHDGFLGVKLGEIMVRTPKPGEKVPDPEIIDQNNPFPIRQGSADSGVLIVDRIQGFVGERVFQQGDVIVGIATQPRHMLIRNTSELKTHVQLFGAGQQVEFLVIRQGQIQTVTVTLDARPDPSLDDGAEPLRTLREDRQKKAEQYWHEVYEPMLRDRVG
jgi:hypothetical protein